MEPQLYKEVMEVLAPHHYEVWCLGGSSNLLPQGVDVDPNDIDLVTDAKGIQHYREALREYLVRDYYNDRTCAYTLEFKIKGVEVEILHYDDPSKAMLEKVKHMTWQGLELNILPLPDARKFYAGIGKKEKVKLIEKYL